MDISRKNERHIITLLSHTLADEPGHGFIALIDFRIKKEERQFLRLCELEHIANQIQHGLAAPPIVKFLPGRMGKQLLAKRVAAGIVFNCFVNQRLHYDWKFQPHTDAPVLFSGRHGHKVVEQTGHFFCSMNFAYEDDLFRALIRPCGRFLGISLGRLGLRKHPA
jgi:hypothetical protein